MKGKAGGADIAWGKSTNAIKSKKDEAVNATGEAIAGNLSVKTDVSSMNTKA